MIHRLTVTGWGKITNNAKINLNSLLNYQASARKLSKAKIPGVAIRRCQKENLYKNRLDPKVQLCAGGEEGTISQLICRIYIVDATNFVLGLAR